MNNSAKKDTSKSSKASKPFGVLEPYPNRVFLVRNAENVTEILDVLKTAYSVKKEIEIRSRTFTEGGISKEFKYFQLPNLPPVYLVYLSNPGVGPKNVRDVFDLAAFTKVPLIPYVHPFAISLFKLAMLQNFPAILLHDTEELHAYLNGKLIGQDEKEIIFSERQKQVYVTEKIMLQGAFAKQKASVKEKREEKKKARRSDNTTPRTVKVLPKEKSEPQPAVKSNKPKKAVLNGYKDVVKKGVTPEIPQDRADSRVGRRGPRAGRETKQEKKVAAPTKSNWSMPIDDEEVFVPSQETQASKPADSVVQAAIPVVAPAPVQFNTPGLFAQHPPQMTLEMWNALASIAHSQTATASVTN